MCYDKGNWMEETKGLTWVESCRQEDYSFKQKGVKCESVTCDHYSLSMSKFIHLKPHTWPNHGALLVFYLCIHQKRSLFVFMFHKNRYL